MDVGRMMMVVTYCGSRIVRECQHAVIDNDYGIRLDDSAGHVSSSTINTACNGIDVNNKKTAETMLLTS